MTEPTVDRPLGPSDHDARFAEALAEVAAALGATDAELLDEREYLAPRVDVRAVRERLGMTQQAFADSFCLPVGTIRNWEQGRRAPDGPARVLLRLLARSPEVALAVLGPAMLGPDALNAALAVDDTARPHERFRASARWVRGFDPRAAVAGGGAAPLMRFLSAPEDVPARVVTVGAGGGASPAGFGVVAVHLARPLALPERAQFSMVVASRVVGEGYVTDYLD